MKIDRLILAILMSLVVITGCAEVRYRFSDMHEFDQRKWMAAGFDDPEEAVKWKRNKFEPKEAQQWKKSGFSPEEANKWNELKFSIEKASQWREASFTAGEAGEWFDHGNKFESPIAAQKWKKLSFSSKEAFWWNAGNVSTDKALQLQKSIIYKKWREASVEYLDIPNWQKHKFSPEIAAKFAPYSYSPESAFRELEIMAEIAELLGYKPSANEEGNISRLIAVSSELPDRQELLQTNPYENNGKCYYLNYAKGVQLLDKHTGLFDVGYCNGEKHLALLKFKYSATPAIGEEIKAKVIGKGAFEYINVLGSKQIIHKLEVVGSLSNQIANPYWPND